MKQKEFLDLIIRFADHSIPALTNRHIYLWIGEMNDLISQCPKGFFKILDLHSLCLELEKVPYGDEAARRELSNIIENWITNQFLPSRKQRGLLINGLDLLYRYRIPMSLFTRLATESCMIVLSISAMDVSFNPSKPLPEYIKLSPSDILRYLTTEIPDESIVKEE